MCTWVHKPMGGQKYFDLSSGEQHFLDTSWTCHAFFILSLLPSPPPLLMIGPLHRNLSHLIKPISVIHNCRVVTTFVFLAITFNLNQLFGDVYMNTAISGALELPALYLCYMLLKKYGRKPSVSIPFIFVGICFLLSVPFEIFEGKSQEL